MQSSHTTQLVLPQLIREDSLLLLRSLPQATQLDQRLEGIVEKCSGDRIHLDLLLAVSEEESDIENSLARRQSTELSIEDRVYPALHDYTFKHVLAHEVAYQSLLSEHRRALHERIATLLETRIANIPLYQLDVLAHYFTEAGINEKTAGCRQQATRDAYQAFRLPCDR